MEDRRQTIVLILVVVFFLIGIVVAYVLSDPSGKGGPGLRSDQRFKAKPGTTRQNAMALMSSKRPAGVDDISGGESDTPPENPVTVRSISPAESAQDAGGAGNAQERAIERALTAQTPEEGIQILNEAMAAATTAEAQSRLNLAMAELQVKRNPPDPDAAAACFDRAFQLAPAVDVRNEAALYAAETLRRAGRADLAMQQLQRAIEALPDAAPASAVELKIRVLYGDSLAAAGELPGAERAYAAAVERGSRGSIMLNSEAVESLRLAAIRLSQLYRSQARHAEAEAVAQQVQARLRHEETPAF